MKIDKPNPFILRKKELMEWDHSRILPFTISDAPFNPYGNGNPIWTVPEIPYNNIHPIWIIPPQPLYMNSNTEQFVFVYGYGGTAIISYSNDVYGNDDKQTEYNNCVYDQNY